MSPKAEYRNIEDIRTFNMRNRMKQSTKKTVDVIDFGFVKYSNRYSSGLKFVPNKMLRDMTYIHEEVVMDMFINPLFENESDSQEGLSEEYESYDSYDENSKQKKSRFSLRRKNSKNKSKSSIRVVAI